MPKPHITQQMHVISLIDNATFFKPIALAYIISEKDQELARPKLLPHAALAALRKKMMSQLSSMPAGVAPILQNESQAASLTA
jgi:hypothetical protein